MKISEYIINNVDPNSSGELIAKVHCKHYGFDCNSEVYTCTGELDKTHVVTAKIKMICKFKSKSKNNWTVTFYDSTMQELSEENIRDFVNFELNYLYKQYNSKEYD